ncbi:MAG: hypothetical protein H8E26_13950 [FCB group bacterium]|nr:hypothetical protein [FCB group bacterium]MBL7029310.1 hypothetical protein [Candidatus Neomarinimicrobiota bacterium]MBL7122632.1 hypothetical protein [Candidatus Neomarinimicrobiota bacterium]
MSIAKKQMVIFLTLVLLIPGTSGLSAQTSRNFSEQTKLIRIKKIVTEWQGSILTLHTRDGQEIHGRLTEVSGGNYHMDLASGEITIPLEDVVKVSFKPGTPELLLSIASAAMGGAFLSGAILIANDEANSMDVGIATLLGLLGGGLWGYSTFYETEVIELE